MPTIEITGRVTKRSLMKRSKDVLARAKAAEDSLQAGRTRIVEPPRAKDASLPAVGSFHG